MEELTPRSNTLNSSRHSLSHHSSHPGSSSNKKALKNPQAPVDPIQQQQPEQQMEQMQETEQDIQGNLLIAEEEKAKMLMEQHGRRIKRDILENLNELRLVKKLPKLHSDYLSTLIADDYVEYLKSNPHDSDLFKQVCDDYGSSIPTDLIMSSSNFEGENGIPENFMDEFIDLGYTLLETEQDRAQLLDPQLNSIGIGVSMTREKIFIVALVSQKMLQVTAIKDAEGEQKGIEVKGVMLSDTHGVYAVRLQKHETKKDLALVGPEFIEFDTKTKEFTAFLETEEEGIEGASKVIELYVRRKPETIAYKVASKEKVHLNHLEFAQRCPCVVFPVPKHVQEDKDDKEVRMQEKAKKKRTELDKKTKKDEESRERRQVKQIIKDKIAAAAEEEGSPSPTEIVQGIMHGISKRKRRYQELKKTEQEEEREYRNSLRRRMNLSTQPDELLQQETTEQKEDMEVKDTENTGTDEEEEDEKEESGDEEEEEEDGQEPVADKNTQILLEIETALEAGNQELTTQEDKNFYLQILISQLKNKDLPAEKEIEFNMTEAKYANMLAHVHEIRMNLKKSQDTYNAMAKDLQQRLEKKQKDCSEIKSAFKALMKEVTGNAIYHHKISKNSDKKFEKWDMDEEEKAKELQTLRLETFRMEAQLTKNQKALKKRDELADGLHLIDYEQLKIENQTLCEKIQERSENLAKMAKNHMGVVEVLTHLKEKVHFLLRVNERLKTENEGVEKEMNAIRTRVNDLKREVQKYKTRNEEIRQETGIMSSPILRKDYEKTLGKIDKDSVVMDYLEAKHEYMSQIVNAYIKQNKWSKNIGSPTYQRKMFL